MQHYMIAYDAFQTKTEHFWTKKRHFVQSRLENSLLSGRTDIYRKTEGIQSYLRILKRYDPRHEAKKVGFMGVA